MKIRLARESDLPGIDRIYSQAIALKMATADTVPYTERERKDWFYSHTPDKYPVYVAENDDLLSGYLTLTAYRPRREALKYAVEISYFVDEGMRGRGVGTSLLEFGIKLARDLDYRFIVAILMGHNMASIALLEKFGFAEWGRLPGIAVYDNTWYDHLIYGLKV